MVWPEVPAFASANAKSTEWTEKSRNPMTVVDGVRFEKSNREASSIGNSVEVSGVASANNDVSVGSRDRIGSEFLILTFIKADEHGLANSPIASSICGYGLDFQRSIATPRTQ